MKRFSMAFDNPQSNTLRQNLMYAYQTQMAKASEMKTMGKGDRLAGSMIDRVHKTRPGCSACGK
jgi:hypothetical protein